MVRLIILVLIIIGGIWMFRACENDGEKVEFTSKEQTTDKKEKQSTREAKESREEKVSKTDAKKAEAEKEGLDKIFIKSGFEWREPGCSMCLGMNNDSLLPYERCASTSNRNFEGRQGDKGRTHLVSPSMAALAAIKGHFSNVIEFINEK